MEKIDRLRLTQFSRGSELKIKNVNDFMKTAFKESIWSSVLTVEIGDDLADSVDFVEYLRAAGKMKTLVLGRNNSVDKIIGNISVIDVLDIGCPLGDVKDL